MTLQSPDELKIMIDWEDRLIDKIHEQRKLMIWLKYEKRKLMNCEKSAIRRPSLLSPVHTMVFDGLRVILSEWGWLKKNMFIQFIICVKQTNNWLKSPSNLCFSCVNKLTSKFLQSFLAWKQFCFWWLLIQFNLLTLTLTKDQRLSAVEISKLNRIRITAQIPIRKNTNPKD